MRHFCRSLAHAFVPIVGIDLVADHSEPEFLNPHDGRGLIIRVGLFVNIVGRPEVQWLHAKLAGEKTLSELDLKIQLPS